MLWQFLFPPLSHYLHSKITPAHVDFLHRNAIASSVTPKLCSNCLQSSFVLYSVIQIINCTQQKQLVLPVLTYGCHIPVSVSKKILDEKSFPSAQCQQGLDFKISPWYMHPPTHKNKGWTD